MRYLFLNMSAISLILTMETVMASALMNKATNQKMQQAILTKTKGKNFNVSSLSDQEKSWIYEVDLLKDLTTLKKSSPDDLQDISSTLSNLGTFYISQSKTNKSAKTQIDKIYTQKVDADLKQIAGKTEQELEDEGSMVFAFLYSLKDKKLIPDILYNKLFTKSVDMKSKTQLKQVYEKLDTESVEDKKGKALFDDATIENILKSNPELKTS